MESAANYALRAIQPTLLAGRTFIKDIAAGVLSTAKVVVVFAGCLALLGGAVLISSEDARAVLTSRLSGTKVVTAEVADSTSFANPRPSTSCCSRAQMIRSRNASCSIWCVATVSPTKPFACWCQCFQIGKERSLDPLLILSVVAVESSLILSLKVLSARKG